MGDVYSESRGRQDRMEAETAEADLVQDLINTTALCRDACSKIARQARERFAKVTRAQFGANDYRVMFHNPAW